MNSINLEPTGIAGRGQKILVRILFLILSISTNSFAGDCFFNSDYKIKIPNSKESQPFGTLLEKMKTPEKQVEKITLKYFTENGRTSSLDDSGVSWFDIADFNNDLKFRIISVQIGSAWDHLYIVFKKTSDGWLFLKCLPISQVDDSKAINVFNFQHHLFLVLVDVEDHGMGTSGWFSSANYDFYLMDQGMEEAGHSIAYGNHDGAIMGTLT
jgi:hypothetical protein